MRSMLPLSAYHDELKILPRRAVFLAFARQHGGVCNHCSALLYRTRGCLLRFNHSPRVIPERASEVVGIAQHRRSPCRLRTATKFWQPFGILTEQMSAFLSPIPRRPWAAAIRYAGSGSTVLWACSAVLSPARLTFHQCFGWLCWSFWAWFAIASPLFLGGPRGSHRRDLRANCDIVGAVPARPPNSSSHRSVDARLARSFQLLCVSFNEIARLAEYDHRALIALSSYYDNSWDSGTSCSN